MLVHLREMRNPAVFVTLLMALSMHHQFCRAQNATEEGTWRAGATACTDVEASGIDQCTSAGSGFTMNQKKNEQCPQSHEPMSEWTCDEWKCHVYCSNPIRDEERKSCTNCEEVGVGDACWEERKEACLAFKEASEGECDVDCNTAYRVEAVASSRSILLISCLFAATMALI